MMIFANFMSAPAAEARMFFDITWTPPANIQVSVGATQDADAALAALVLQGCIGQYGLRICTPESAATIRGMANPKLALLRLEEDPASGREQVVTLTAKGEAYIAAIIERGTQCVQRIIDLMSAEEIINGLAFPARIRISSALGAHPTNEHRRGDCADIRASRVPRSAQYR